MDRDQGLRGQSVAGVTPVTPRWRPSASIVDTLGVLDSLRLYLVGCGGHASDVLSIIEACNEAGSQYQVAGFLDDDLEADCRKLTVRGVVRVGVVGSTVPVDGRVVLGVGYPEPRAQVVERLAGWAHLAEPIVHPRAELATGAAVGSGSVVFGGCHLGPSARLGRAVMLGRGAVVGHDVTANDFATVMPGAVVSGNCAIGVGALIGANATVLEGLSIGDWARLGAGAVLTQDLPAGCTAVGIPARIVRSAP